MKLHQELYYIADRLNAGVISRKTAFEEIKKLETRDPYQYYFGRAMQEALASQIIIRERLLSDRRETERRVALSIFEQVRSEHYAAYTKKLCHAKEEYAERLKEISEMV